MENDNYPMGLGRVYCGAKTRTGGKCGQVAMSNGRCRYHGGLSPSGTEHGSFVHGYYTKAAIASRKRFSGLLRDMKAQLGRM